MVLCKYDSKQKVILMRWLRDANEFSIEIRLLFSRKVVAGTTKFCRGPTLAPAGSPARWRHPRPLISRIVRKVGRPEGNAVRAEL